MATRTPPRIIVVTHSFYLGWSESSRIGKEIDRLLPDVSFVLPHTTTMAVSVSDAFVVSSAVFEDMMARKQFLVTEKVFDVWHGIAHEKIEDAVNSGNTPLIIVSLPVLPELKMRLGESMIHVMMKTSPVLSGAAQLWANSVNHAMQPVLF